MRKLDAAALLGVSLALLAAGGSVLPPRRSIKPSKPGPDRDWGKLQPEFARRLRLVFADLEARGWKPVLNEGWRSPERAAALAQAGSGVERSMHCYGLAADVREARSGWGDPLFFQALGAAAEAEGMTWGGRWKRADATHVQAVPVSEQARVRAEGEQLGYELAGARALIRRWA